MSITERVQMLADQMNVSFNDVLNLAQRVSTSMIQDGIKVEHASTNELKSNFVEAYLMDDRRKLRTTVVLENLQKVLKKDEALDQVLGNHLKELLEG